MDKGSGRYQWDVSQQGVSVVTKLGPNATVQGQMNNVITDFDRQRNLWCICGALIRVSGCCTMKRIFGVENKLREFIVAVLNLCIAYGVAYVLGI